MMLLEGLDWYVSYELAFSGELGRIHNAFHVSVLRKYTRKPDHVIRLDEVNLVEDLIYEEVPVQIMDHQFPHLRSKRILMAKWFGGTKWSRQQLGRR
ncbi:hypothetical protein LINPERPRIM_LOCUS31568 [Linum perenne]